MAPPGSAGQRFQNRGKHASGVHPDTRPREDARGVYPVNQELP